MKPQTGEIEEAEKETAAKHLLKAKLYIVDCKLAEAEQHFLKSVLLHSSFENNIALADFYFDLKRLPEAIEYYDRALSLASSWRKRIRIRKKLKSARSS